MEFAISQPKMVRLQRIANISVEQGASNVTIRFYLGHGLALDFSRSNMWFAISQHKMVRLPRNEKQTYRLHFRPQMWPSCLTWLWDWPWIVKVKYGNCYISSLQNKIWNLQDWSTTLPKFIYMTKKESLPDRPKFCRSGSAVRHLKTVSQPKKVILSWNETPT